MAQERRRRGGEEGGNPQGTFQRFQAPGFKRASGFKRPTERTEETEVNKENDTKEMKFHPREDDRRESKSKKPGRKRQEPILL